MNDDFKEIRKCESFDFVRKYVRLLSKITDAPTEFQEAAALFLLSTAAGRKWVFQSIPDTAVFGDKIDITGKLLNLWLIILGKTRVSRKTSGVLSHVEGISKKVFGERRLISEAFTPEALIKEMSEKSVRSTTGTLKTVCSWICDEVAGFFQHLKKRDSYMISADAFLSKIYDGSTYTRSTIGRGKETVYNPYLTCLLASTDYLPTLFDELQIRLGFMNRFIYVIGKREKRRPLRTEPLTEEERREVNEIEGFLRALAGKASVTVLEMSNEVKQLYDSFEEKIEERIESEDLGIKEGYCGQLPNLAVRLCCVYRIGRMTPEEIRNYRDPALTVKLQDVERAINYVWKAWDWFGEVVEIIQSAKPSKLREKERAKTAIIEYLSDGTEKHVVEMQKSVIRRTGVSPATFYNALKELIREGKIRRSRKGVYKLVLLTSLRGDENG